MQLKYLPMINSRLWRSSPADPCESRQQFRKSGNLALAGVASLALLLGSGASAQLAPGTAKSGKTSFLGTDGVLVQMPTPPQPGLIIGMASTNQVMVTITNGVSYANYELYRRTLIDPAHPWALRIVGTQGQTNFITDMPFALSFFEVGVGSDWDSDGIPNSQDGDPLDPNTGTLSVTIDSPTQGGIFQ